MAVSAYNPRTNSITEVWRIKDIQTGNDIPFNTLKYDDETIVRVEFDYKGNWAYRPISSLFFVEHDNQINSK